MSVRAVARALLSVSDKRGLDVLARGLAERGVELLSTGGTAAALRDAGLEVVDVADYTGFPELLGGRVKTLHPKIHGGLLGKRDDAEHDRQMRDNGVEGIDLVVMNLYPFEDTIRGDGGFDECLENIDIGGVAAVRSAAKNHAYVAVVTSPEQYDELLEDIERNNGTSHSLRKRLAAQAFRASSEYDTMISDWLATAEEDEPAEARHAKVVEFPVRRAYKPTIELKYGCNPHQTPATVGTVDGGGMPLKVLSGSPGYINLLDAVNAWQLVAEASKALSLPAAASFKHVSPAGVGLAVPLSDAEADAYGVVGKDLTPSALAYVRARNADPMCSFGDFAAVSEVVDEATAKVLKSEVSDGIIAPGFEPAALEILRKKKRGGYIVLEADPDFVPPEMEYREVFGMSFAQRRNDRPVTLDDVDPALVATQRTDLPDAARRDLLLASVAVKYTQSNSIAFAMNGQVLGIGAGQQSRVDCVQLAARKAATWRLRQHAKVAALAFRDGVKRPDKVNARVRYINGEFTDAEWETFLHLFEYAPQTLGLAEKAAFLDGLSGVSLASDAFFPFRDSLDAAARVGVSYVVQPGGSVNDAQVIEAADALGMTMLANGVRHFHH